MTSMHCLDSIYRQSGFNDKVKYDFVRIAAMDIPDVATFAMNRETSNCEELEEAAKYFENTMKSFKLPSTNLDTKTEIRRELQSSKDVKLLVCSKARVQIYRVEDRHFGRTAF